MSQRRAKQALISTPTARRSGAPAGGKPGFRERCAARGAAGHCHSRVCRRTRPHCYPMRSAATAGTALRPSPAPSPSSHVARHFSRLLSSPTSAHPGRQVAGQTCRLQPWPVGRHACCGNVAKQRPHAQRAAQRQESKGFIRQWLHHQCSALLCSAP